MKRILALLSILLFIMPLVWCTSCVQTEIEFIAEKPVYSLNAYRTKERFLAFTNYAKIEDYDVFEDFSSFYKNEVKDKIDGNFYLLKSSDGLLGWVPHCLYKTVDLFADSFTEEKYINPIIYVGICLRDKSLKQVNPSLVDGNSIENICLDAVFPVINVDAVDKNFILEFGNNNSIGIYETYVNIYSGQTCIGTCFYEAKVKVSYNWFANYFKNYLNLITEE